MLNGWSHWITKFRVWHPFLLYPNTRVLRKELKCTHITRHPHITPLFSALVLLLHPDIWIQGWKCPTVGWYFCLQVELQMCCNPGICSDNHSKNLYWYSITNYKCRNPQKSVNFSEILCPQNSENSVCHQIFMNNVLGFSLHNGKQSRIKLLGFVLAF